MRDIQDRMRNFLGMELVRIKAGSFTIGVPDGELGKDPHEGPEKKITISRDFYMGLYPVTQKEYLQLTGDNLSKYQGDYLPVQMVYREDAQAFCRRLSEVDGRRYALPTEAQWEYACRAGEPGPYCFGDDVDRLGEYAWYGDNSCGQPHPVGLKKPNSWGLFDMHGNVWEWCEGIWDQQNGYALFAEVDPVGTTGYTPVIRGGCFYSEPQAVRSGKRFGFHDQRCESVGFRVICELE